MTGSHDDHPPTHTEMRQQCTMRQIGRLNTGATIMSAIRILLASIVPFSALCAATIAGAQQPLGQIVRCRVVDAATNEPLAARVYIRNTSGTWHFATSIGGTAVRYQKERPGSPSVEMHTTVSAHPFSAQLGPGTYLVTIERG